MIKHRRPITIESVAANLEASKLISLQVAIKSDTVLITDRAAVSSAWWALVGKHDAQRGA